MKTIKEEKNGSAKPTSGLKKVSDSKKNTDKLKTTNPTKVKITPEGPGNSALATSEKDPIDNEVKVMKSKEKETEKTADGTFKTTVLDVEFEVKGRSYADVNSLYIIGLIRKHLEGRGDVVQSVKIEMGPKKESLKETKLRSLIKRVYENIRSGK